MREKRINELNLPKRLYYTLDEAAKLIGEECNTDYLIHLGATGFIYDLITPLPEIDSAWVPEKYDSSKNRYNVSKENPYFSPYGGVIFGRLTPADVSWVEVNGYVSVSAFTDAYEVVRTSSGHRRFENIDGVKSLFDNASGIVNKEKIFMSFSTIDNIVNGRPFEQRLKNNDFSKKHKNNIELKGGETALRMLAGISLLLSEKHQKYRRGDTPNKSAIANDIEVICRNIPNIDNYGLDAENIRKYLPEALALLIGR